MNNFVKYFWEFNFCVIIIYLFKSVLDFFFPESITELKDSFNFFFKFCFGVIIIYLFKSVLNFFFVERPCTNKKKCESQTRTEYVLIFTKHTGTSTSLSTWDNFNNQPLDKVETQTDNLESNFAMFGKLREEYPSFIPSLRFTHSEFKCILENSVSHVISADDTHKIVQESIDSLDTFSSAEDNSSNPWILCKKKEKKDKFKTKKKKPKKTKSKSSVRELSEITVSGALKTHEIVTQLDSCELASTSNGKHNSSAKIKKHKKRYKNKKSKLLESSKNDHLDHKSNNVKGTTLFSFEKDIETKSKAPIKAIAKPISHLTLSETNTGTGTPKVETNIPQCSNTDKTQSNTAITNIPKCSEINEAQDNANISNSLNFTKLSKSKTYELPCTSPTKHIADKSPIKRNSEAKSVVNNSPAKHIAGKSPMKTAMLQCSEISKPFSDTVVSPQKCSEFINICKHIKAEKYNGVFATEDAQKNEEFLQQLNLFRQINKTIKTGTSETSNSNTASNSATSFANELLNSNAKKETPNLQAKNKFSKKKINKNETNNAFYPSKNKPKKSHSEIRAENTMNCLFPDECEIPEPQRPTVSSNVSQTSKNYRMDKITSIEVTSFSVSKGVTIYREQCFLYGISICGHSLNKVLQKGQTVEYELEEGTTHDVRECWIGRRVEDQKERYETVETYCNAHRILPKIKFELLREIDYIPDDCAPLLTTKEAVQIVCL